MSDKSKGVALIVGAGAGLSASIARALANEGYQIALAARTVDDLDGLKSETDAAAFACDASDPAQVEALFKGVDGLDAELDVVVFNAGYRTRGPLIDLDPAEVKKTLIVSGLGGFLVGQQAAQRLLPRADGQGRVVAVEVRVVTGTARETLRSPEGNLPLKDVMERGVHPYGMQTFEMAMRDLVKGGLLDVETARAALG